MQLDLLLPMVSRRGVVGGGRAQLLGLGALFAAALLLIGCTSTPDWPARYSAHLNRTVLELDESYLNRSFRDDVEMGTLTRVAWAKLDGGSIVFLGLPPHGLTTEEVVRRTVVLDEAEWKQACAAALGEPLTSWSMPHEHRGNALRIYPNSRTDVYCTFYYLPQGWELRMVRVADIPDPCR